MDKQSDIDGQSNCGKPTCTVLLNASSQNSLDGKVSWFVCACSSLSNVIILGCLLSYAILFPKILEEFHEGKAKTALVASLGMGVYSFLSPISAKLCVLFGCRVVMVGSGLICSLGLLGSSFAANIYNLYFSYGVVLGFASSMVYNAGFQVIPLYFDKHRSLATAMVSSGPGTGILFLSPITQTLLDNFDWRKTLTVLGSINMIPTILGWSITRKNKQIKTLKSETSTEGCCSFLDLTVFKDPMFVILSLSMVVAVLGHYMPPMHLAKYAEDVGIPSHLSSWIYVTIGSTSLISRLVIGKLCDTGWVPLLRIFQCGILILAIANYCLPLASNLSFLLMYSVSFGVGESMYTTPMYCLVLNSYGGIGFGWFVFVNVIPLFMGPTLAGFIADIAGSYHPAFYIAGIIMTVSACMVELTNCVKPKSKEVENKWYIRREEIVVVLERETVI